MLEIKCDRCNQILEHVCNEDFSETLKRLYQFKLECRMGSKAMEDAFKGMPYY